MECIKINDYRSKEFKWVHSLYKEAFPFNERIPLKIYFKHKKVLIDIYKEDSNIIGFICYCFLKDTYYIYFFATDSKFRNKGLGTQILESFKKEHPNKTIYLLAEALTNNPIKDELISRRLIFYQRNGFVLEDYKVDEFGVIYNVLSYNGKTPYETYNAMMKYVHYKFLYWFTFKDNKVD